MKLLSWSERVYCALLVLYPAEFRHDFGHHMAQVFRDVCRDTYRQGGAWGLANWWAAAFFDLLQTVITEHRKGGFTMSQAKFIQWSGWFCILGGSFFAASSISQLQAGVQTYQLSIAALVPGMILIMLGMLGMYLRYSQMHIFGKLALLTAIVGAGMAAIGCLLVITAGNSFWNLFMVGWIVYLAGHSNFGGFAASEKLLPKWRFSLLIGSALPLTIAVLGLPLLGSANLSMFVMLLLIAIGWIVTGLALNSQPAVLSQPMIGA